MNEFIQAVTKDYMNFQTRSRRKDYWMFVLFNAIISMVLVVLGGVFSGGSSTSSGIGSIFMIVYGLYSLAILLPSIAITARRLHDTGRSGWLQLITLIPVVGGIILLVLLVQDSQPGSNKWGPNPKGVGAAGQQGVGASNW